MEFFLFAALVWLAFLASKQSRLRTELEGRISQLVARLEDFEKERWDMRRRVVELERQLAAGVSATAPPTPAGPGAVRDAPVKKPEPVAAPVVTPLAVTSEAPEIPTAPSPVPPPRAVEAPKVPPAAPVPPPLIRVELPKPPVPTIAPPPASPRVEPLPGRPVAVSPAPPKRRISFDVEETLGANWLGKIGVIVLVIGVVFWLGYQLPRMSHGAKVALGYVVSLAMLGGGVYLERKERYRLFARAGIGGGWALVFYVTYAMYFTEAARIPWIKEWVDLVLLLMVAAGMVVHTLRYNSQVVTGFAFLLAFTTVALSHNTVYSLSAGAILAIGLVAIVKPKGWFELEIFGLLASYMNHYFWLRTIIEPMGGHKQPFAEFVPSALLLVTYWAAFRWSYIARKIESVAQENVSTVAALLNTSLLLGLMKYQAVKSGLAFYVLLVLGAIELTLGQLPVTRRRRTAFVILSTIGITLLLAAVPFKYGGEAAGSILWLAESQALFLAGVLTREVLFRRFGMLAALLTAGHMLWFNAQPVLLARSGTASDQPAFAMALAFAVAAVLFHANAHWVPRRWKVLFDSDFEEGCFKALSYLGGLMAFVGAFLAFPYVWTAVAWTALAMLLAFLGQRLNIREFSVQAHLLAAFGLAAAMGINREATGTYLHVTLRLLTLSLMAGMLYLTSRWSDGLRAAAREVSEVYTSAGSFLVVMVAFYECHWAWIAVAWAVFGFVLAVLGKRFSRRELSYQAHVIAAMVVARMLMVNIDATEKWHSMTLRLLTFALVAAILYVSSRWAGPKESESAGYFSAGYTWAGSILVAVLGYKELPDGWTAVAWATFALLLAFLGRSFGRAELLWQAHALAAVAFTRALYVNMTQLDGRYGRLSLRLISVSLVAALLYVCTRWVKTRAEDDEPYSASISAGYSWAGSMLVSVLMWYELRPINVALGWALFGLVLFELGFARLSTSLRLQGYVAFIAAFTRIFFVNLNAEGNPGELSPRLITTLPLALVFYYAYERVQGRDDDSLQLDRKLYAAPLLSYFGTVTVAALLRFELPLDWVVAGWAAVVLGLVAIAWKAEKYVFQHQAFLLGAALLFRTVFHNFWQPKHTAVTLWDSRPLAVGATIALLFLSLAFAFPLRRKLEARNGVGGATGRIARMVGRPEQVFFFLPLVLLTWLIWLDVPPGRVTLAWGLEAVLVFLFALWVNQRSFRLTGLALLLVCVVKIVVVDVWKLETGDRYLTFISLGAALIGVSFLYTRFREKIREYL